MNKRKVFVMGIDAMDPKITQQYLDEGVMPNLQKLIERGAARDNLAMIGGHPTVTPPMWTTLGTGASPFVHSVHDFSRKGAYVGQKEYNFDSRYCLAEPMWNVTAEAGIKTLVWHWPGSSWPPTSDNPNLMVVDGTQPEGVNCGNAVVDEEMLLVASNQTTEVKFREKAATDTKVPCFITGLEFGDEETNKDEYSALQGLKSNQARDAVVTCSYEEAEKFSLSAVPMDVIYSPIKTAENWAAAPADAKECTLLLSKGLIHRPCLILKNENGVYDSVQIYKSKKEISPLATIKAGVYTQDIVDDAFNNKDEKIQVNRSMRILDIAEDGSSLRMWISSAMDFHNNTLWHPKSLLSEIVANVGYPQPVSIGGAQDEQLIADCMRASWDASGDWTAASIKYLMKQYDLGMVFSHFHNIDLQGHMLVQYLKTGNSGLSAETLQGLFREVYIQTDNYIGQYMSLLDDGWTIMIVSDHGQTTPEYHIGTLLAGAENINGMEMVDWGFTVLKEGTNGEKLVDWSKTKAVMWRTGEIWLNLKGRDFHDGVEGIVEPSDVLGSEQWLLEEEIMDRLLETKSPVTGKRMVQFAFRNKDAIVLGMGGPGAGDIIYMNAEGYTADHADCLSTANGVLNTSCQSIFIAAGAGIKENFKTPRVVHHVDVVPTIATLLETRMPETCEGAPIYQILK